MAPLPAVPGPDVSPPPAAPPAPELANPLPEARVTSGFGGRRDPKDGERRRHEGLDLAAPAGTPIHAPAAARVAVAVERYGEDGRLGRTVVLDHGGGLETLYAHLGSIAVAEGDQVESGDVIGKIGSSGWVTGAHLHLEVRLDGRPVDPAGRIPGLE
jgi:murein DD-endopeptidase MepM/ murein hydrolase activator NlpD